MCASTAQIKGSPGFYQTAGAYYGARLSLADRDFETGFVNTGGRCLKRRIIVLAQGTDGLYRTIQPTAFSSPSSPVVAPRLSHFC